MASFSFYFESDEERSIKSKHRFRINEKRDIDRHLKDMIKIVTHGFKIFVYFIYESVSDNAPILEEYLQSRLMAAVQRGELRRFHLNQVIVRCLYEGKTHDDDAEDD